MRARDFLIEAISGTVSFKQLFHVGSLDAGLKREHSYEGAGLSVSTHPDAWREIGRGAVVGDTYKATKPNNTFLSAYKLNKSAKAEIAKWAEEHDLLMPIETVRVSWFDDELDNTMYQEFSSMEEAMEEYGDLDGYEVTTNRSGYTPTNKLKQLSKNPNLAPTGVLDYVLPLYAEAEGYDGVWWQDSLDVSRYSAPRGVIVPSKISTWELTKV
jgi:hypothetical protein